MPTRLPIACAAALSDLRANQELQRRVEQIVQGRLVEGIAVARGKPRNFRPAAVSSRRSSAIAIRGCLLLGLTIAGLAGCAEPTASRIDDRTFLIDGPGRPSEFGAATQRIAERLCPRGYSILKRFGRSDAPDCISDELPMRGNWTVRCG